jgi:ubiquinone/menaquinone biosynthesis C-methylase UbiE
MHNLPEQDWRQFYEHEAQEYDHLRYGTCYGQLFRRLHHETLIDLLKPHASGRVLDVAAGTGHVTLLLAKMGFDVTALDLTENMLQLAKKKLHEQNLRSNFFLGSALSLPFANESFHLVVSTRFLHLWPYEQQKAVLAEMARVLISGGILIVDFDNWWHKTLLSLPIFIYQKFTGKGRKVGEYYNRFRQAILLAESVGIHINDIRGVGGYHLFLPAIFSQALAMALGRVNASTPLRVLSEQFILRGQKS